MFSRGNAGERRPPTFFTRGTPSPHLFYEGNAVPPPFLQGERRPPTFFTRGTPSPHLFYKGNAVPPPFLRGERRSPTFFTRGTAFPLPESKQGERRSVKFMQRMLFDTVLFWVSHVLQYVGFLAIIAQHPMQFNLPET